MRRDKTNEDGDKKMRKEEQLEDKADESGSSSALWETAEPNWVFGSEKHSKTLRIARKWTMSDGQSADEDVNKKRFK